MFYTLIKNGFLTNQSARGFYLYYNFKYHNHQKYNTRGFNFKTVCIGFTLGLLRTVNVQ